MSLQYIIDGYNLTKHPLISPHLKRAKSERNSLLEYIRSRHLTGSLKNKVTVVFDGFPESGASPEEGGFSIVFSKDISADEKIRKLVEGSANPKNIIVVSDDREVKFFARAAKAKALGVEEFAGTIKKREEKIDDSLEAKVTYSQMQKINEELRRLWL